MTQSDRDTPKLLSLLYTYEGEVGDEDEYTSTALIAGSSINGRSAVLENCNLNRTRIVQAPGVRIQQSRLETVDAANATMDESGWRDVLIEESRLTGARMNFSHIARTTFDSCLMKHAQIQESTFKDVCFDSCDLRGAYFSGSQMQGTVFSGSNLAGADFSRAVISACDFRRATIEDIRISPQQLQSVIVTADQALYLAKLLGLDIRE